MRTKVSRRDGALAGGVLLVGAVFFLAWAFPVWPGDEAVLASFQGWQSSELAAFFRILSNVGRVPVAVTLVFAATALLLLNRRRADALLLALIIVPMALGPLLKLAVGRPRPEYAIFDPIPQSLSFPSGHASFALIFGGILIYLAGKRVRHAWARRGLIGGLVLLILLLGVSRVSLGVHWPSDVIGGYLYGGLALVALIRLRDFLTACARRREGRVQVNRADDTRTPQ